MAITLNQYIADLAAGKFEPNIAQINAVRISAASALRADSINRIVNEGKGSNGQQLGTYSEKPMYATPEQFINRSGFSPQGKNGKREGAKSMYLPQGYKQLRAVQGRETAFVNQEYRGELNADYQQQLLPDNTILTGFTQSKQIAKKKALERKYGKSYQGTQEEINRYNQRCVEGYAKIARGENTGL